MSRSRLILMQRAGSMLETATLDDSGGTRQEDGLLDAFIDELRDRQRRED